MLSEEQIRQALHASRVVPLAVEKPHDPLGLEQLVDCSVSFRTNYRVFLSGPGIQIPATPGPREGMRKPAIVLRPTGLEMVDQMLARSGLNTPEIFVRKGTQQQCRLIEPAGVRRRIEHPQAGMARQVGCGGPGDVR
jgi:hypothetical protein